MDAILFKQANTIYVADGCNDLPVSRTMDTETQCYNLTSCWEPTDEEMTYIQECIANNQKPKIYLSMLSKGHPPVWIGCNLYEEEDNNGKGNDTSSL